MTDLNYLRTLFHVLISANILLLILARPSPQLSLEEAQRFLQEEETAPTPQVSLDSARVLLQSMRRTYTNSEYYDISLLENPTDVPIRHVASNEYSQVNPEGVLPNRDGPTMTLGDFLGENPGDYNSKTENTGQPGAGGYNPDTEGVPKNWSGGSDLSSHRTETRTPERQHSWDEPFRYNYTTSGPLGFSPCDGIGPCLRPTGYEANETRTEEEIEKDLWHPTNTNMTREEWLRCGGMSCEEKTMAEDLLQLLTTELVLSEFESPEAELPMTKCGSEECRKMLTMFGCAKFTVPQLQDMLTALRRRRDLDLVDRDVQTQEDVGISRPAPGRQKRKLIDFTVKSFHKWPTTTPIPYMFDGTHTYQEQQIIRNGFQHWMDKTCLRFTELNRLLSYQYTGRINYILITRVQTQGCLSFIGMIPNKKPQQLNLAPDCISEFGIPVHEIGHALGYFHEQQRLDRDSYITVNWNNVVAGYTDQLQKAAGTVIQPCPYDYSSIMHYAPDDASRNGLATITARDALYQSSMGQRVELSFLDTKCINNAYCSNECNFNPLRGTCAHSGYQDPKNCNQCRCPDGLGGQLCNDVEPSTYGKYSAASGCGGTINLQQGGQAQTINSPNYPRAYPQNNRCNWKIVARSNCKVQISFNQLDTFGIYTSPNNGPTCYHWLEVKYSSDFGKSGPRFCGSRVGTQQLVSETNEMLATFRSIFAVPRSPFTGQPDVPFQLVGFKAQVSAVQCTGNPPVGGGACNINQQYLCRNGAQCIADTTVSLGFRCNCPAGYQGTYCESQCANFNCNPVAPPGPSGGGCPVTLDLVFILDSSGSVMWWNWPKMLEFACNLVDQLTVGPNAAWVGVVVFGNNANIAIQFWTNNDKEALKTNIRGLQYGPYYTNTAAGLQVARQLLQQGRSNAAKKAILVTDGPSNRDSYLTLPNAQQLRNIGADIIAVGVGNNVDQNELQGITGDQTKVTYVVAGFDALDDYATSTNVLNNMCGTTSTGNPGGPSGPGNSVSFSCDFETGFCNMVQKNPSFTFTRTDVGTPSYATGPTAAGQGRFYVFIETSYGRQRGEEASMAFPSSFMQQITTPSQMCLRFKYHMYGAGIGSLNVYLIRNGGARENAFRRNGDQGNTWNSAQVALSNVQSTDEILFEATTTSSSTAHVYQGDTALDDIRLDSGSC